VGTGVGVTVGKGVAVGSSVALGAGVGVGADAGAQADNTRLTSKKTSNVRFIVCVLFSGVKQPNGTELSRYAEQAERRQVEAQGGRHFVIYGFIHNRIIHRLDLQTMAKRYKLMSLKRHSKKISVSC